MTAANAIWRRGKWRRYAHRAWAWCVGWVDAL